jgi:hypothetical protein
MATTQQNHLREASICATWKSVVRKKATARTRFHSHDG